MPAKPRVPRGQSLPRRRAFAERVFRARRRSREMYQVREMLEFLPQKSIGVANALSGNRR